MTEPAAYTEDSSKPPYVYTPTHVEVFETQTVVTKPQAAPTFLKMLQFTLQTLYMMMQHPDRELVFSLDPEHKWAYLSASVLVDETATVDEIARARQTLLDTFDRFVDASRSGFSRVTLTDADEKQRPNLIIQ